MIFYNGTQPAPDHEILKLASAFEGEGDAPKGKDKPLPLELVVDVYNINAGHNSAIQEACETLKGYANFVSRVRENQKAVPLEDAVNKAVDECIKEGILADFLRDSKAEVVGVSIFEFDREEYEKIILAEEREENEARGEARGEHNKAVSTARNFLAMGVLSVEQIAQGTGSSVEEVAAL